MEELRKKLRDAASDVSEDTHHVSLACDLVEACLQQSPEDRQVAIPYICFVLSTILVIFLFYYDPSTAIREPADELLYRLRVTEPRAKFVKTVDTLGLGPIDFAPHVRKHIRVSVQLEIISRRIVTLAQRIPFFRRVCCIHPSACLCLN